MKNNAKRRGYVCVRKIAKSPHLITPPILAVHRLISFAINSDSFFSVSNWPREGVDPRG